MLETGIRRATGRSHEGTFQGQKPVLPSETAAVAGEASVAADDPVAGNQDGDALMDPTKQVKYANKRFPALMYLK